MSPYGSRLARGVLDSDDSTATTKIATSASAPASVAETSKAVVATSTSIAAKASTSFAAASASSVGAVAGESVTTATAAAAAATATATGTSDASGSGAWDTVEECYAQGVSNCDWKAHEGAILGGIFGGLALIAFVIYLLIKRSRRKAKDRADLDAALRSKSGG